MKKIRVVFSKQGPERGHDIYVGHGILNGRVLPRVTADRSRAFVFYDERLRERSLALASELEAIGWHTTLFHVRGGESLKEIGQVFRLYGLLLRNGADRASVVYVLGGGSLGDAIGFVASTYMRGISWVNIPTTLLAQVDSAIGGKTGINHPVGKNLIGAFHQPMRVICDTALMSSLPGRDRVSGLGEIIKYALISDKKLFETLERDWTRIIDLEPGVIEHAVACCAELKARIVEHDEHDRLGVREVLNFGHTVGHALEKFCGYGKFRHGEAVLWGMRVAVALSETRGHLASSERARIDALLQAIPTPRLPRNLKLENVVRLIQFDKKKYRGKVRFVLLKRIGKACLDPGVSESELREALQEVLG